MAQIQPAQQVTEDGEARLSRRIHLPDTLVALDPTRVCEHRHPRERPAMFVSLLIIAALVAGAIWYRDFAVLGGVAAVWLSMLLLAFQAPTVHTLRGAAITSTQFPQLFAMLEEVASEFNAPPTEAFVIRDARAQAHAYGVKAPYAIVLHSALLDSLNPEELRFVVGQQMGRIVYGHTRTTAWLGGDSESLPALLGHVAWLRDLFFAWYRRVTLLSSDRAGALACGDMEVAIRTLVKLDVGNNQYHEVRGDDLVGQLYRVNQGVSRIQAAVIWTTSAVPPNLRRLQELLIWGGLPKHRAVPSAAVPSPSVPLAQQDGEIGDSRT